MSTDNRLQETGNTATNDRARREFYSTAGKAVAMGLMTAQERDTICRPGTRKAGYWSRHLLDLQAVLAERGFDTVKDTH